MAKDDQGPYTNVLEIGMLPTACLPPSELLWLRRKFGRSNIIFAIKMSSAQHLAIFIHLPTSSALATTSNNHRNCEIGCTVSRRGESIFPESRDTFIAMPTHAPAWISAKIARHGQAKLFSGQFLMITVRQKKQAQLGRSVLSMGQWASLIISTLGDRNMLKYINRYCTSHI